MGDAAGCGQPNKVLSPSGSVLLGKAITAASRRSLPSVCAGVCLGGELKKARLGRDLKDEEELG